MKLSIVWMLIVAFILAGVPASAQQPSLAATEPRVALAGEGPIAAAAHRESLRIPLDVGAAQESPAVTTVKKQARRLSIGDKVTVTMRSGEKIRGRLGRVSESSIEVLTAKDSGYNAFGERVRAEAPAANVEVPFEQVQRIHKPLSGVAIGAIVVAGIVGCQLILRAATGWND